MSEDMDSKKRFSVGFRQEVEVGRLRRELDQAKEARVTKNGKGETKNAEVERLQIALERAENTRRQSECLRHKDVQKAVESRDRASYEQVAQNLPAFCSLLLKFEHLATVAGITGNQASEVLTLRAFGPLPDPIAIGEKLLSQEERMRGSSVEDALEKAIHPLHEWLRRANLAEVKYHPTLDWAVGHYKPADFEKHDLGQVVVPTAFMVAAKQISILELEPQEKGTLSLSIGELLTDELGQTPIVMHGRVPAEPAKPSHAIDEMLGGEQDAEGHVAQAGEAEPEAVAVAHDTEPQGERAQAIGGTTSEVSTPEPPPGGWSSIPDASTTAPAISIPEAGRDTHPDKGPGGNIHRIYNDPSKSNPVTYFVRQVAQELVPGHDSSAIF